MFSKYGDNQYLSSIISKAGLIFTGRTTRRGLVGSVLTYYMKSQGSRPRPDINTKYQNYFCGDFFLADFCQKLCE